MYRRCLYKFYELYCNQASYSEEVEEPTSMGARLGKVGHVALQAFYSGKPYKLAEDWAYQAFGPTTEEEEKDFSRLRQTLTLYWAHTMTDRWKVEQVETKVEVGQYQGIFDLVVLTADGQRWIVDHKFQKSKQTSHLTVTPQVSFYLLMAKELRMKVDGLLYNIIPTGEPGKPIRKLCFRSDNFLANFKRELDLQIEQMTEFQLKPTPYRNFTSDCVWDCPIKDECFQQMERKWQPQFPPLVQLQR